MKKIILILFIHLYAFNSDKGTGYLPIPKSIVPKKYNVDFFKKEYFSNKVFSDLTTYLPLNYVKDGTIDYTGFLQKGLDENKYITFPDFPILINDIGLSIKSNTIVTFQKKSKLILKSSSKETYEILKLHNVKNVIIYNANIVGDRTTHRGNKGEWGMGIAIRSCLNINIVNPKIENCWGDGIYIGQLRDHLNRKRIFDASKSVSIYNAYINYNRRNGLSIVAGEDINIYNSLFANTMGTFPKAGIDIEPDIGGKVKIVDTNTFNNGAKGIDIFFRGLNLSKENYVDVTIINHKDLMSPIGVRIAGYKDFREGIRKKIKGNVIIKNPIWNKNRTALIIEENQSLSPIILIQNVKGNDMKGNLINSKTVKSSAKIHSNNKEAKIIIE